MYFSMSLMETLPVLKLYFVLDYTNAGEVLY